MKNKGSGIQTVTSAAGVVERPAEGFSRLFRRSLLGGVAVSLFAFPLCAKSARAQTPQINTVQFSGSAGNYTLTLKGSGFGKPTVSLPFTGDVANFRIADGAQLGHGEWGYTGDANALAYESWSDSTIAVAGFGGQPCDSVTLAVWNSASKLGGTWGGNVPCSVSPPQITSVALSGTGTALQIVVHGTGFGSAPSTLPPQGTAGDSNYFWFLDFRSHCGASSSLFEAGFDRWGANSPDAVTVHYQSWTDDQIIISGFGGAYGTGCATYVAGDPIAIVVYNSEDTSDTEAQAAWGGPAAAGITLSVQDLTTGKSIAPGGTITAGDQFQVTVTSAPQYNCAGQFVVTAVGASGAPPSALVQIVPFIIGPFTGGNSATGGILTSNGTSGDENDWKISASCNGGNTNSFAFGQFEFLSAVQ
jgi:hypothetical protein